jgi:hypothetical protein
MPQILRLHAREMLDSHGNSARKADVMPSDDLSAGLIDWPSTTSFCGSNSSSVAKLDTQAPKGSCVHRLRKLRKPV